MVEGLTVDAQEERLKRVILAVSVAGMLEW